VSLPLHTVRFGAFRLDLRAGELQHDGTRTKLPEQLFQILCELVEHPGEVVTREELRQRLWPSDAFVDFEHGLNTAVMRLREALGDSAERPRYVETLPRHGYRLIVPVEKPRAVDSGSFQSSPEDLVDSCSFDGCGGRSWRRLATTAAGPFPPGKD
jgi:DNA-binding winged helix-turn-helix (wHTH) protein